MTSLKIRQLRKMEGELKHPVIISSINEYISLMKRYKDYLQHFSSLGNTLGKKLLMGNYRQQAWNKLGVKLYLDSSGYEVVFQNNSRLTDYLRSKDDLTVDKLIDLYCNHEFESIRSDFSTPVVIAEQVLYQLPATVYCFRSNCNLDGIIENLLSIRSGKVDRLVAEFS